jgi:hypothetical protein
MSGPFDSAHRKIARASKHFDEVEAQIKAYYDQIPYKQVIETDPDDPQQLLHKIKLVKTLADSSVAEIVGDVVNNLRAALDHAIYAVAKTCRSNPKYAYFPFSGKAERFEKSLNGFCKDVPSEMFPLLRSFRPYEGGNEPLFALNAMRNADNHSILTPFGTRLFRPRTKVKGTGYMSMTVPEHSAWDIAKQEIVFLRTGADATFDYDIDFHFFVAFDEVPTVKGMPVMETLELIGSEVNQVVAAIEAEAARLGFLPTRQADGR